MQILPPKEKIGIANSQGGSEGEIKTAESVHKSYLKKLMDKKLRT